MKNRIILVARYYSIEPLGILHLAGTARDAGWDCKVVLIDGTDFKPLYDAVLEWKPQIVGFQIWTGYHLPAFIACDSVRSMGVPVVIGGPHATYFDEDCKLHADWVVKGGSFGLFEQVLDNSLSKGMHFNKIGRKENFPFPNRGLVYDVYPEFGKSPIKSIMASVGCPFFCTYCYAPAFNKMHSGFSLTVRPVDDLVVEAQEILKRWPLSMIYFQDDIFGYDVKWLEEFAVKWKSKVDIPFHCQIRLELTRGDKGRRRLDLFVQAGCSGITLAIESGSAFLRDHVLFRHMPDELIVEGCNEIMSRGMTLRTEQILAVPFSNEETELSTLELNHRINPTMAWTSILSPYQGTDMGRIAGDFGFYEGNNDDLADSFLDSSVLKHVAGGPSDIEGIIKQQGFGQKDRPLLKMRSVRGNGLKAEVLLAEKSVGGITYLSVDQNEQYRKNIVRLQRLFMWIAKVPSAEALGRALLAVPESEWSWNKIGSVTEHHLASSVGRVSMQSWKSQLADEMLCDVDALPAPIAENPWYFVFFPAGGALAHLAIKQKVFENSSVTDTLDVLVTIMRRHLFSYDLYKIEKGRDAIAK